jgi:hypothetical protein
MTTVEFLFCDWASSCGRKVRFSHAKHASMRIQKILQSGDGLNVDSLATYHCQFCAGFHVGHMRARGRV